MTKYSILKKLLTTLLLTLPSFSLSWEKADADLLRACKEKDSSIEEIREALDGGANIHVKSQFNGQTCLMTAVLHGRLEAVKLLADRGADFSIGEQNGYTPPHGAAFQGRPKVMEYLIESKIDVTEFHKDGYAPLHRTCWGNSKNHYETFLVLVNHGVDPALEVKAEGKEGEQCKDITANKFIKKYFRELAEQEEKSESESESGLEEEEKDEKPKADEIPSAQNDEL